MAVTPWFELSASQIRSLLHLLYNSAKQFGMKNPVERFDLINHLPRAEETIRLNGKGLNETITYLARV